MPNNYFPLYTDYLFSMKINNIFPFTRGKIITVNII